MVTTAISPAPGEQEPEAKISAMGRVTGVLFSPTETFKDIVQKPNWIVPLLILTAFSMVVCYFLVQKVDWVAFQRKNIESSSFPSDLTQEQKDQAVERNVKFTTPITYAIGLLGPIISTSDYHADLLGVVQHLQGRGTEIWNRVRDCEPRDCAGGDWSCAHYRRFGFETRGRC